MLTKPIFTARMRTASFAVPSYVKALKRGEIEPAREYSRARARPATALTMATMAWFNVGVTMAANLRVELAQERA